MSKSSEHKNSDSVRVIFEPLYKRRLSDEEVLEIESNLKAFGKAVLKAAGKISSKPSAN